MRQLPFAALSLAFAVAAVAAPPAGFEQHVEAARTRIGVPGMAIAMSAMTAAMSSTGIHRRSDCQKSCDHKCSKC